MRRDERGAAVVVAVSLVGLLVSVAVAVAVGVALVGTHRTAQAAADLASLAGATALQHGDDACATAADIARRNRARVTDCAVDGWEVAVVAVADVRLPLGRVTLGARARAGPVTDVSRRQS